MALLSCGEEQLGGRLCNLSLFLIRLSRSCLMLKSGVAVSSLNDTNHSETILKY